MRMRGCMLLATALAVGVCSSPALAQPTALAPDLSQVVENGYFHDKDLRTRPWRAAVRSTHPPGQVGYAPLSVELRRFEASPRARVATAAERVTVASPRIRFVGWLLLALATLALATLLVTFAGSPWGLLVALLLPLAPGAPQLTRLALFHDDHLALLFALIAAVCAARAGRVGRTARAPYGWCAGLALATAGAALAADAGVVLGLGFALGALLVPRDARDVRAVLRSSARVPLFTCLAVVSLYALLRVAAIAPAPEGIQGGPDSAPLMERAALGARQLASTASPSILPGFAAIEGVSVASIAALSALFAFLAFARQTGALVVTLSGALYATLSVGAEPAFSTRAVVFLVPGLALFVAPALGRVHAGEPITPERDRLEVVVRRAGIALAVAALLGFAAKSIPSWSRLSSTESLAARGPERDGRVLRAIGAHYNGRSSDTFNEIAAIVSTTTAVRDVEHYYLMLAALAQGNEGLSQNIGIVFAREAPSSPYRAVASLRHAQSYETSSFRIASTSFLEAIKRNPDLLEAAVGLADLLHSVGEHGGARVAMEQIVELYAGRAIPLIVQIELATARVRDGQREPGLELLRSLARENPDRPEPRARLGAMLIETGALDEARSVLEAASKLAPDDVQVMQNLAALHLRQGRTDEAEQILLRALTQSGVPEDDPIQVTTYHSLALIERLRRQPGRALERVSKGLQIDPRHRPSVMLKGDVYLELGRVEEAFQTYAYLLSLRADDPHARLRLGWANYARGDYEHAKSEALEVRERTKDSTLLNEADRLLRAAAAKTLK